MSDAPFYYATLMLKAPISLEVREGDLADLILQRGDRKLIVRAYQQLKTYFQKNPERLEKALCLKLFPKTSTEGYLNEYSHVIWASDQPPDNFKEGFRALGELRYVSKEDAFFVLKIWPNPKGYLKQSFKLTLLASLELIESLPAIGSGIEVWGDLKANSLKLVISSFKQVDLPPKSELAKAEAKAKKPKNAKPKKPSL